MHANLSRCCAVLLLAVAACHPSVNAQKSVIETVAGDDEERHRLFEATLKMLDEKPEYVDELFGRLLMHLPARDKFLVLSTSGLRDEAFSKLMAKHLVEYPESVRIICIALINAVYQDPEAQKAFLAAIRDRKAEVSHMLLADPKTLGEVVAALGGAGAGDLGGKLKTIVTGKPAPESHEPSPSPPPSKQ